MENYEFARKIESMIAGLEHYYQYHAQTTSLELFNYAENQLMKGLSAMWETLVSHDLRTNYT
jgi:hypothetical protein